MRRAALALAALLLLAWSGPVPSPRKVYIPAASLCSDGAWPDLRAYGGKANFGPVAPDSCAWIDGQTARTPITLACGALVSDPAVQGTYPGGTAACPVPPAQDFR